MEPAAYEGDKEAFFGRYGEIQAPKAVCEKEITNTSGNGEIPSPALQVPIDLGRKESKEVVFTLGVSRSREHHREMIQKYSDPSAASAGAQQGPRRSRIHFVNAATVETPDKAMNFMTNIWLKYQAISARILGALRLLSVERRLRFSGPVAGQPDFFATKPELAKKQILLHAEQQFPDGTVYHWWHPGTSMGASHPYVGRFALAFYSDRDELCG